MHWILIQWYDTNRQSILYSGLTELQSSVVRRQAKLEGLVLGEGECDGVTGNPIDIEGIIRSSGIRAKTC